MKGRYRIREHCGGRYQRKRGLKRVHELVKLLRRHGVEKIEVTERSVASARKSPVVPYWSIKADPRTTYYEVEFEGGS